jgi:hypothetical protein
MEIKDQRNVPILKFCVRRRPLRPPPQWAELNVGDWPRRGSPPGTTRGEMRKSAGTWALA